MLGLKQSLMQAAANVHFPPKAVFPNICDLEVHRMALSGGKGRKAVVRGYEANGPF